MGDRRPNTNKKAGNAPLFAALTSFLFCLPALWFGTIEVLWKTNMIHMRGGDPWSSFVLASYLAPYATALAIPLVLISFVGATGRPLLRTASLIILALAMIASIYDMRDVLPFVRV